MRFPSVNDVIGAERAEDDHRERTNGAQ
jgi:hypothetical protein